MLSRIADATYWMSRYLERVANTAHLIEIELSRVLEPDDGNGPVSAWQPLLGIAGSEQAYRVTQGAAEVAAGRVLQGLGGEAASPAAVRACLRLARDNARAARGRISKDMWDCLNELCLRAEPLLARAGAAERLTAFCRFVATEVTRFHGITLTTMMRGEAFAFYQLGTFIERADMTARILDLHHHLVRPQPSLAGAPLEDGRWAALLKSLSGLEAFRRTHQAGLDAPRVARFVALSPDFPRSLRFSMDRVDRALDAVTRDVSAGATVAAARTLRATIATFGEVADSGTDLHDRLQQVMERVAALDRALFDEFFAGAVAEVACAT